MLDLLEKVFKEKMQTAEWQQKIRAVVPTYGSTLTENPHLIDQTLAYTSEVLGCVTKLRAKPIRFPRFRHRRSRSK
ncbi:Malate:quinone oxidoreductase [Kluyvera cryocrescens]|uniref:malate dehydrogenase (quinone) n=1 Tax=Kluyvera cryocrescens TaxID=580 RepID=A0A485BYF8_KLUCR|nr:Malate:quinone oxidoreductase [Kluyvera cryocrescens]